MLVGTLPFLLHVRMVKLKASNGVKLSLKKRILLLKLLVWVNLRSKSPFNILYYFAFHQ